MDSASTPSSLTPIPPPKLEGRGHSQRLVPVALGLVLWSDPATSPVSDLLSGTRLAIRHKDVAVPPNRLDVARARRIRFHELAYPRYLHVHAAAVGVAAWAAGKFDQPVPGERPMGVLHE